MCVCVCVFLIYFGDSPTDQAGRVTSLCVYSGDYTLQRVFCPSEPTGVTQEGVNTGAFFFFLLFL